MLWGRISLVTRSSLLTRSLLLGRHLRNTPYRAESYVTAKSGSSQPSTTLYVENFSHTTTDSDLKNVFHGCTNAEIVFDTQTGQSKGYAFVKYPSVNEAKAVLDQPKDIVLDGRTLNIEFSRTHAMRRGNDKPSSILFVGNLSHTTTESTLKEAFSGCIDARIISHAVRNGKRKYFGFVEYSGVDGAKAVFDQQDNVVLDGRILFIGYGRPKADDNATVRKGNKKPTSELFVGNLSPTTTETDLMETFEGCLNARIIYDTQIGYQSKRYGFVEYRNVEEATAALNQQEKVIMDGHALNIDYAQSQAVKKERNESTESSSLYVRNLSPATTKSGLMDAFDGCISAKIILNAETGKSRGFGFVKYSSVEEAKAVYDQQEDIVLDGRTLFIDYNTDQIQGKSEPTTTLFVRNLSPTTTKEAVMTAFDGCANAAIITDPETGQNKGYGFVDYYSLDEAKAVFDQVEDIVLDGRTLLVDYRLPQMDTSSIPVKRGSNKPYRTLFVGGLSLKTTEGSLMEAFGGCTKATIMTGSQGRSRGIGFVEYASVEEAEGVFDHPENIELDGRILFINYAKARVGINEDTGEADVQDNPMDDNQGPISTEYEK